MTRTIHSTKVVRALSTGVIEFLHHPASLVRLSPILLDIVPDERDEDAYIVTERLVILGFYKTQTTFRCTFTKRADGLDCVVRAGLWTTLRTKWRVNCADDEGACLVTEEAEVEVRILLNLLVIRIKLTMPIPIGHILLHAFHHGHCDQVPSRNNGEAGYKARDLGWL